MKLSILVLTTLLLGCGEYRQLTRQLPTFVNMQTMAREIQRIYERDGSVTEDQAQSILMMINEGRDEWGHRIVYAASSDPASFVLISPGQDGVFERGAPSQYFDAPREDIVGQLDRDIVFRDGEPVTIASSK